MTLDVLKQRIYGTLRKHFPQDTVDVSSGFEDNIHVVVVSRKFDGLGEREKQDLIWSLLDKELKPKEANRVSRIVAMSPEDVKATS